MSSSGEAELSWSRCVDSFVNSIEDPSIKSEDIIVATLNASGTLLWEHDVANKDFFANFAVLASYILSRRLDAGKPVNGDFILSCRKLIKYSIEFLKCTEKYSLIRSYRVIEIINALCYGAETPDKDDIMGILYAKYTIKDSKYPDDSYLRQDTTYKAPIAATADRDLALQQFLTTAMEANAQQYSCLHQNMIHGFVDTTFHIPSFDRQPKKGNIAFFCQCGGPELLWSYCKSLSIFNTVLSKLHKGTGTNINVGDPLLLSNADDELVELVSNRLNDIEDQLSILSKCISLITVHALEDNVISDIALLPLLCIKCALLFIASTAKQSTLSQDNLQNDPLSIVKNALVIADTICEALERQCGEKISSNLYTAIGVQTINGLQMSLQLDKDRKNFSGISQLALLIGPWAISVLSRVIQRNRHETFQDSDSVDNLDLLKPHFADHQISFILSSVPIFDNLLSLIYDTFSNCTSVAKKSLSSSSGSKSSLEGGVSKVSISGFEDHESSSSDDEESSSLLGNLFESNVANNANSKASNQPETPSPSTVVQDHDSSSSLSATSEEFMLSKSLYLCSSALQFLTIVLESMSNNVITTYQNLVSHVNVITACDIIKELDKGVGKLFKVSKGGEALDSEVPEFTYFSKYLSRFLHTLIGKNVLSLELQYGMLSQLCIHPMKTQPWPLTIHSRSLAILAHICLCQQRSHEDSDTSIAVELWENVLSTLFEKAISSTEEKLYEDDVNVELAQLLVLLFHNLTSQKRRAIFEKALDYILKIANENWTILLEKNPLYFSRLLLFLDYFLHQYSSCSDELQMQVQANVFSSVLSLNEYGVNRKLIKGKSPHEKKYYSIYGYEEECYINSIISAVNPSGTAKLPVLKAHLAPRFYSLYCMSKQQCPDADAMQILQQRKHIALFYDHLYETFIKLLSVGETFENTFTDLCHPTPLDASSVRHCVHTVWRILGCLPPSLAYLKEISCSNEDFPNKLRSSSILHWLRIINTLNNDFVQRSLDLQGYTSDASSLKDQLNSVQNNWKDRFNNAHRHIKLILGALKDDYIPTSRMTACLVGLLMECLNCQKSMENLISPEKTVVIFDILETTSSLLSVTKRYARACLASYLNQSFYKTVNDVIQDRRLSAYFTTLTAGNILMQENNDNQDRFIRDIILKGSTIIEKWNEGVISGPAPSWFKDCPERFESELAVMLSKNDIYSVLISHLGAMSNNVPFDRSECLKHVLAEIVFYNTFICNSFRNVTIVQEMKESVLSDHFPLLLDSTTYFLKAEVTELLETFVGSSNSDEFKRHVTYYSLSGSYWLLMEYAKDESKISEDMALQSLKFVGSLCDSDDGRNALQRFFVTDETEIIQLLFMIRRNHVSITLSCEVLRFFIKLLKTAKELPSDNPFYAICSSIAKFDKFPKEDIQDWFMKMLTISLKNDSDANDSLNLEHDQHFENFISVITTENCWPVEWENAFSTLVSLGDDILSYNYKSVKLFMAICRLYASAAIDSCGHLTLVKFAMLWLKYLFTKIENTISTDTDIDNTVHANDLMNIMDAAPPLCNYLTDILLALNRTHTENRVTRSTFRSNDNGITQELYENDYKELNTCDESDEDDSDEEALCNRLCTYTMTQKEFMNQHWYYCYTCKMVDNTGVCSTCVRVCHKDHEISYAKYSSFFCDCGAKEDGSCRALIKRTPEGEVDQPGSPFLPSDSEDIDHEELFGIKSNVENGKGQLAAAHQGVTSGVISNSTAGLLECSNDAGDKEPKYIHILSQQIQDYKDRLTELLGSSTLISTMLEVLKSMLSSYKQERELSAACRRAIQAARYLSDLHQLRMNVETSDQIMIPTLGSQEGAFDNVRLSYSGDQGQTIRQLINSHALHRVSLCCLMSLHSKRQYLAISHDKGRLTILQLSSLLKQPDSNKRRLTLTSLASVNLPFTVISIWSNICNDDYVAVCGLKDCHVLTLSSSGSVTDHLVLHPSVSSTNYIIKAIWLPGSQTELAIITTDFIKIYDLAVDAISPCFYFLLPGGKIRDVSFICKGKKRSMILMSSNGCLYSQPMNDLSNAANGPFYLTNTIAINDAISHNLEMVNGQIGGGGVSVYYSHLLQLLFFSVTQGKTYVGVLDEDFCRLDKISLIELRGSNKSLQALCQWKEVYHHPGLICTQTLSGTPIIMYIKPDTITVQEIKSPSKAKVQDVVAIRHPSLGSSSTRTSLIILNDDGSLRIYLANMDLVGFWSSSVFQPISELTAIKPVKKKKAVESSKSLSGINFPVDFFETCQLTNEVEYGGSDLLQIYNVQQIKNRLNANGMYIASNKPNGFSVEIKNTNSSHVMVGIRVQIGCQSTDKIPAYIEVFGRAINFKPKMSRWYDIPFTREESLTADKKITLFFASSTDSNGMTIVDGIRVYIKTKENFRWPEETNDESIAQMHQDGTQTVKLQESDSTDEVRSTIFHSMDSLIAQSLELLENYFIFWPSDISDANTQLALSCSTSLLTFATPTSVHSQSKALLAALLSSQSAYHYHKDQAQLHHAAGFLILEDKESTLEDFFESKHKRDNEIKIDLFERLIRIARSIAIARPINLITFANSIDRNGGEEFNNRTVTGIMSRPASNSIRDGTTPQLIERLMNNFWQLYSSSPSSPLIVPVGQSRLSRIETIVFGLVDIVSAFAVMDSSYVSMATDLYVKLLLHEDSAIGFSCKQALGFVLRQRTKKKRVVLSLPPNPRDDVATEQDEQSVEATSDVGEPKHSETVDQPVTLSSLVSAANNLGPGLGTLAEMASTHGSLESLLSGGAVQISPILDANDEEAMMELAVSLSIQDAQAGSLIEVGVLSDATASAVSDEEGEMDSTAATVASSTMRGSPRAAGSECNSAAESLTGDVVGVSSATTSVDGEYVNADTGSTSARLIKDDIIMKSTETVSEIGDEALVVSSKLHNLRCHFLESFLDHFPKLRNLDGLQIVPFMQVVFMLCSDFDDQEHERQTLINVIDTIVSELDLQSQGFSGLTDRSSRHDLQLMFLKFLGVLMTKVKGMSRSALSACVLTASYLMRYNILDYCLGALKELSTYWKEVYPTHQYVSSVGVLLKERRTNLLPDMSPFFLRRHVRTHVNDVFANYVQQLTEILLKIPYQIKKLAESQGADMVIPEFRQEWFNILSEYMILQLTPAVRRAARKLLMYLCGSKQVYRRQLDLYTIKYHIAKVQEICSSHGFRLSSTYIRPISISLPYDVVSQMVKHLRECLDISIARPASWHSFCFSNDIIVPYLIQVTVAFDEGIAPIILDLLAISYRENDNTNSSSISNATSSLSESTNPSLTRKIFEIIPKTTLAHFLRKFLLESNVHNVRFQTLCLMLSIYESASMEDQKVVVDVLCDLWPLIPAYGRKAKEFVGLLGHISSKVLVAKKLNALSIKVIELLRVLNEKLKNHPNASIYNQLMSFVDFEGYYLESYPCLVCNNPEIPFNVVKLTSLKADTRYTASTQIVKLSCSHMISAVTIRISDIKRAKMIRTINIYYNTKTVQAIVELKNKRLWDKALSCQLNQNQSEMKVELPLPVVATNVMIEFADFYDNFQASAETLQCPRCSASVPANPGICNHCGENVYQCHKCRAINYDERDPFLCNSCGFCKYAKFDINVTARPCCSVEPIKNDEDRKKVMSHIDTLLERADVIYKQLAAYRTPINALLAKVSESNDTKESNEGHTSSSTSSSSGSRVSKTIQLLSQKYASDCKSSFDELSKIIQEILISRKELTDYNSKQSLGELNVDSTNSQILLGSDESSKNVVSIHSIGKCYGCTVAAVENCVTVMKAFATNEIMKSLLCEEDIIEELMKNNLHSGTTRIHNTTRELLCLLAKDNKSISKQISYILERRVQQSIFSHYTKDNLAASLHQEMRLLIDTVDLEDSCWEDRLKTVIRLCLVASKTNCPVTIENVVVPCLRILSKLIQLPMSTSSNKKGKPGHALVSISTDGPEVYVNVKNWLIDDHGRVYENWKKMSPSKLAVSLNSTSCEKFHETYLMSKYSRLWKFNIQLRHGKAALLSSNQLLLSESWLHDVLFSPSRSARQIICSILDSVCQDSYVCHRILDLLTQLLDYIDDAGEKAMELLQTYKKLTRPRHWKLYLVVKKLIPRIEILMEKEVQKLLLLEESSLSSDLTQGLSLKMLTEILIAIANQEQVKVRCRSQLMRIVLNSYLSIRRLVIQRTKIIDETQDLLLEILEELVGGTEDEVKDFIKTCVQILRKCHPNDMKTPMFIIERLCSTIYPEPDNESDEFLIIVDKDPQQEDFLQGRMQGNPYSSSSHGMGPLMRDIKNKICTDCELVALLEDDNSMELLVNNKIISLDLPVSKVYKKVWAGEANSPMKIIYRMTGLLGDATEDIIESLESDSEEETDLEESYKLASVVSECGGLEVMLSILATIKNLRGSHDLVNAILKLLQYCINLKSIRSFLLKPSLGALDIMLGTLNLALEMVKESPNGSGAVIIEKLVKIMEAVLQEAATATADETEVLQGRTSEDEHQLATLLEQVSSKYVRSNENVFQALMRLIPFVTFGDVDKIRMLVNYYLPYLDFKSYDEHVNNEGQFSLDCFCRIAENVPNNKNGEKIRDVAIASGVTQKAFVYIEEYNIGQSILVNTAEIKLLPSLPYVLRMLQGLCSKHTKSQLLAENAVIINLHKLEQVSAEEQIGSLAENLLETLSECSLVANMVKGARRNTKIEKKKLAMAMRKKQLEAIGLKTNDKGQLKAKPQLLEQMNEIAEETGLICCVCREGYKYHPKKVLGVYSFTTRTVMDEFEKRSSKTPGYTTVSYFNVIHFDCHASAVRLARSRDEWESAILHNGNTKCNGLLPIWGPEIPESSFAACLASHNNYIQDCTHIEPSFHTSVHDIKHLLLLFAHEKSFSHESGGGGPESNIYLLPYLISMTLYVLNSTRGLMREEKSMKAFVSTPETKWIESAYEIDGPYYYTILSVLVYTHNDWRENRILFLKRLIICAHTRHISPKGTSRLSNKKKAKFEVYRPVLIFFALIDGIYKHFKINLLPGNDGICHSYLEYLRYNDVVVKENCDKLLKLYQRDLLNMESIEEFLDITGLQTEIDNPNEFLTTLLNCIP